MEVREYTERYKRKCKKCHVGWGECTDCVRMCMRGMMWFGRLRLEAARGFKGALHRLGTVGLGWVHKGARGCVRGPDVLGRVS